MVLAVTTVINPNHAGFNQNLQEINEKFKTTIIMTTHNMDFIESLDKKVIKLDK